MTSSKRTEPTSFINVDLEIFSEIDLTKLVKHLSSELCLLHQNVVDGLHHACFEVRPTKPTDEPNEFIATFHQVVFSLPPDLSSVWRSCSRRLLDFGYRSGWKPNIFTSVLSAESMRLIAELQTEFIITIYGTATARKSCRQRA
jgi:hypothetical protein